MACLPRRARNGWLGRLRARLTLLLAIAMPGAEREIDDAVVAKAASGDVRAFGEIVDHYDGRLRGLAFRLLGNRDLMDDVLQEVYVKAFRGLRSFKGDSSIGTWLFRITYNACIDEMRRDRKIVRLFTDTAQDDRPSPGPGPDDVAVARHDLASALATLKPAQRAAVLLVDAYGYNYAEAGSVLGVGAGTVASRLNRARIILRSALRVADG
jgi:RNA polymerase sigma-70 factor (ECF subfamily)